MADSNVVELEVIDGGGEGGDGPLTLRRPDPRACRHYGRGAIVDEAKRVVICKGCEAEIDPIDVLLELARRPERYRDYLARLKRDVEQKTRELDRVKQDISNARARLRTALRQTSA